MISPVQPRRRAWATAPRRGFLSDYGRSDIKLPNGETRRFLADGDEVIFRARAQRAGHVAIGFGECRGRVEPAAPWPGG